MNKQVQNIFVRHFVIFLVSMIGIFALHLPSYAGFFTLQEPKQDTIPPAKKDSINVKTSVADSVYLPSRKPRFVIPDRLSDPFTDRPSISPFMLRNPSLIRLDVELDTGMNYNIFERIGDDFYYRPDTYLTFDEFLQLQDRNSKAEYFRERSLGLDGESAVSGRQLLPPLYVSPAMDRIFGGSFVEIVPNGFVTLDFGGRITRNENPDLPIRQQRNATFNFDQQINMNVVGKVGEKLEVLANFDNNNQFDYRNNLKVEYTGFDEDIIKKIEIGNVAMPTNNSLIAGAQSLFGVKTQMQFGKLWVTSVASTQRGRTESIEIEGGTQGKQFEIRGSDYDENRHFFLGHFFRDNYENWLNNLPQIRSGINITRVEVYVINRAQTSEALRTVAGFMDLAEGREKNIFQSAFYPNSPSSNPPNSNEINPLWSQINNLPKNAQEFESALNGIAGGALVKTTDFELVNVARRLDQREFEYHPQLGYVSLQRALQNDEMLAVAYEYSYNGQRYQVGELAEDFGNRPSNEVILLKLLRPSKINIDVPTWDLMMKNIYNLTGTQITKEGFQLRVIYRDDRTGQDNPSLHESTLKDLPLLRLMNLDSLNQNNDPQPDGNFDYIEGITMESMTGKIIFPVLEPFGDHLENLFQPFETNFKEKYVFRTLYKSTKNDAQQQTTRDKFFLRGSYQAGSASEIMLEGINIAPGSVRVTAGGMPLTENVDYRVDYNFGRVTILNESIMASGKPIRIDFEKEDMFNFAARSLIGTRFDYRFSDDINLGATVLRHLERPIVTRNSIGNEPMRNTKWGVDLSFKKDVPFLTKMVDFLPFIDTKEMSNVTFHGEFAQLIPATSNIVNGEGTSYLDDFEDAAIPFELGSNFNSWNIASTPKTPDNRFVETSLFGENKKRAKIAWYIVDNAFYLSSAVNRPQNLPDGELENHYVRQVDIQEVFKRRDVDLGPQIMQVFDIAYFPNERGPYNFNTNLNEEGRLRNPRSNWGGITRAITSDVDFDKNNVEYIEFWMMDPFIDGPRGVVNDGRPNATNNTTGGKLLFNLGNVSEDIIPDGKLQFENGLPTREGNRDRVDETQWGLVPNTAPLTNAFENASDEARANQDVGFDGIKNEDERTFFASFINALPNLNPQIRQQIENDPAADDFTYYLGDNFDNNFSSILERYKNFNNPDGNTPLSSGDDLARSGTRYPNTEDLNNDKTLQTLEEYYEYEIDLRPGQLNVGQNYIVDEVTSDQDGIKWYLFRIPVRNPDRVEGGINDFKTIRFLRTYLTDFEQPVVLRMARFRFIGSQWRRYEQSLLEPALDETREFERPNFVVSVVNIEENSDPSGNRVPYVLPPGFQQDRDVTSIMQRRLNEQSLQLCVTDLEERDAVAAFKNVNHDLVQYGRLKMFLHAQSAEAQDGDVTAFIRLGTDFDQNYYEIEVPLRITPYGTLDPQEIWPEQNEIDVPFNELYAVKAIRNRVRGQGNQNLPFSEQRGRYKITIKGRPELRTVNSLMIGVRNPEGGDQMRKSVCIWANELRVTDFDQTAGWAANATLNTRLADLANITASGRYTTVGFGGIQQKISERTRENTSDLDLSATVNLHKFFPESLGLQLPMFVSYSSFLSRPYFDPRDEDIPLEASIQRFETQEERNEYMDIVSDRMLRRSINFTNVRKAGMKEDRWITPVNLENFSLTYAYSDVFRSNIETESYIMRNYRGGVAYNYAFPSWEVRPFENVSIFSSPYLQLVKDINFKPVPNDFNARLDVNRDFVRTQLRNDQLTTVGMETFFEKNFNINRVYGMNWSLTENLSLNYRARAFSIIDEMDGDINTQEKRDSLWINAQNLGRMKTFDQNIEANFRVPLNKFPMTDWVNLDLRYGVGYNWNAGSLNQIDSLGNIIQNNRESGITGRVDMMKLYNKVRLLNQINNPPKLKRGEKDTLWINQPQTKLVKGSLKLLMSLKSINFTYNLREGTVLPGFRPRAFLFGMDSSFMAPGIPFLLGSQDPNIRFTAVENNWLATGVSQTQNFMQTRVEDISLRARIEPTKSLNIQLDARRTINGNYQELFRYSQQESSFVSLTPNRSGTYGISTIMLKTAFIGDLDDNVSPVFQEFERNREIIRQRLEMQNTNDGFYDLNQQDVLIAAFMAAYTGKDVNQASLNPFPQIPLPNWRVDYSGLSKIEAIGKVFSAFDITHAYNSSFDVGNFVSAMRYNEGIDFDRRINDYPMPFLVSDSGSFQPVYIIGQIILSERFAPLFGVNVRTKSRLTGRFEIRRERNVALNTQNSQVTEMSSNDYVTDIGFTKAGMKMPFKWKGRSLILKNDLTFRFGVTVRDTKTIQRTLDTGNNVPVNGNMNFQLRPTINYVLNQKLNLDFYFERSINDPIVLVSNRTSTTAFGVRVRFSLAQ